MVDSISQNGAFFSRKYYSLFKIEELFEDKGNSESFLLARGNVFQ